MRDINSAIDPYRDLIAELDDLLHDYGHDDPRLFCQSCVTLQGSCSCALRRTSPSPTHDPGSVACTPAHGDLLAFDIVCVCVGVCVCECQ
jgi:hypothetical protein